MRSQSKFLIVTGVMSLMPVVLWWDQQSPAKINNVPGDIVNYPGKAPVKSGAMSAGESESDGVAGQVSTLKSSSEEIAESPALPVAVGSGEPSLERVDADAEVLDAGTQSVELLVRGLRPVEGRVQVAVFEGARGFPDAAAASERVNVSAGGEETELVLQLKTGAVVAIAVYQDLDSNDVLTKNGLGIPTEPYGFSNNARGTFGPPRFDKAQLTITDALKSLEIRVR